MNDKEKLALWQARLESASAAWEDERERMDEREALYRGKSRLSAFTDRTRGVYERAYHVRNITAENIESMVDPNIPQPKVTPRRKQDEKKAEIIETMIRNELDRLPMEEINDLLERMVPIQGGGFLLVEWDEKGEGRGAGGDISVCALHPKQIVPQDGVTSGVEDMDYVILVLPQTKSYIRARYGADVDSPGGDAAPLQAADAAGDDIVTQYTAFYRGEDGSIGLFSWCGDVILEDLPDYQARRRRRCSACALPVPGGEGNVCPNCGGEDFEEAPLAWEEIWFPIRTAPMKTANCGSSRPVSRPIDPGASR